MASSNSPASDLPRPPRRKRRWLAIAAGVLLVAILAVLLVAPPILSRVAKSTLESQVAKHLFATASVGDVSVSLGGSARVEALDVVDLDGEPVASFRLLTVEADVLGALRGRIRADVALDGLEVHAWVDGDGDWNFVELPRPRPERERDPERERPEGEGDALPELELNFTLTDSRVVVHGPDGRTEIDDLEIALEVNDLTEPASFALSANVKGPDGAGGKLLVEADATLAPDGELDAAAIDLVLRAALQEIDLRAFQPAAQAAAGVETLEGSLELVAQLDVTGGAPTDVLFDLTARHVVATGPFSTEGPLRIDAARIAVPRGAEGPRSIVATIDEAVELHVDETAGGAQWVVDGGGDVTAVAALLAPWLPLQEGREPSGSFRISGNVGTRMDAGALASVYAPLRLEWSELAARTPAGEVVDLGELTTGRIGWTTLYDADAGRAGITALDLLAGPVSGSGEITIIGLGQPDGTPVPENADLSLRADLARATELISRVVDLGELRGTGSLALDVSALEEAGGEGFGLTIRGDDVNVSGLSPGTELLSGAIEGNGELRRADDRWGLSFALQAPGLRTASTVGSELVLGPLEVVLAGALFQDRASPPVDLETIDVSVGLGEGELALIGSLAQTGSGDDWTWGGALRLDGPGLSGELGVGLTPAGQNSALALTVRPQQIPQPLVDQLGDLRLAGRAVEVSLDVTSDADRTTVSGMLGGEQNAVRLAPDEQGNRTRLRLADWSVAIRDVQLESDGALSGSIGVQSPEASMTSASTNAQGVLAYTIELGGPADELRVQGSGGFTDLVWSAIAEGGEATTPEYREDVVDLSFDARIGAEGGPIQLVDLTIAANVLSGSAAATLRFDETGESMRVEGARAAFTYLPDALAAILGPEFPAELSGSKREELTMAFDGEIGELDVAALLRGATGSSRVGIGVLRVAGLENRGALQLDSADGRATARAGLETNGGAMNVDCVFDVREQGTEDVPLRSEFHFDLDGVQASSDTASLLSSLHPLFAPAARGGASDLSGLVSAKLDLVLDGGLPTAFLDGDWTALPIDEFTGSGSFQIDAARLEQSSLLGQMLSLAGVGAIDAVGCDPISFHVDGGRLRYDEPWEWNLDGLVVSFTGDVGLDGSMNLNWNLPITDELIQRESKLALLAGETISIPIRGNVTDPKLEWDGVLSDLLRRAAQRQLEQGLGGILGGG